TTPYTPSLHDALPISPLPLRGGKLTVAGALARFTTIRTKTTACTRKQKRARHWRALFVTKHICSEPLDLDIVLLQRVTDLARGRSEEHTSELQSRENL